jgi:hypothetical protein
MKTTEFLGEQAMWHHKTKLGNFWIVESEENHEFYIGLDDEALGHYKRLEDAIRDIRQQRTGSYRWDVAKNAAVPEDVTEWEEGEPDYWNEFS